MTYAPVTDAVVEYAGQAEYLIGLELPKGCSESESVELLRNFALTASQATYRLLPSGYCNLIGFKAKLCVRGGKSRWVLAAEYVSGFDADLEPLVIAVWSSLCDGAVHFLPRPRFHPQKVGAWLRSDSDFRIVTSEEFGIPPASAETQTARQTPTLRLPVPIFTAENVELGPEVPFWTPSGIPIWADRRIWVSTTKSPYFGFSSECGRNGFGACLLSHFFIEEGNGVDTSTSCYPASPEWMGMHLQEELKRSWDLRDSRVAPIRGTERMRFKSGQHLYETLFGALE